MNNAPQTQPGTAGSPTGSPSDPRLAAGLFEFGERLVTLCDGRPGLRGGFVAEARAVEDSPDRPVIDFIASSGQLDRYDEIVSADGWRLENYRRNPVFQNAHQYGDVLFTLGRALITEVRDGRLFQRVEFATEISPMARIAYGLYKGKFLNAVSVGFIPLRWENGGEGAGYRRKYLEQELLEVSAVGIPANPEALQLGLKAGAIERSDLRELSGLLARLAAPAPTDPPIFRSHTAVPDTFACAPGVRGDGAHWLRLARAIARVLRG